MCFSSKDRDDDNGRVTPVRRSQSQSYVLAAQQKREAAALAARREAEREEVAWREADRLDDARREAERQEAARREVARRETERQEAARREAAARAEAERRAAERRAAEREAARVAAQIQAAADREAAEREVARATLRARQNAKVDREPCRATGPKSLPTEIRHCTELLLRMYKNERAVFNLRLARDEDADVEMAGLKREANDLWSTIRGTVEPWIAMEGDKWDDEESLVVHEIDQTVKSQQASRYIFS